MVIILIIIIIIIIINNKCGDGYDKKKNELT
jgi:hypothetical protein